ncbi:MAG: acyl-CoA dehydrogenase C-terminal domain-containing protein [Burkholderiales bacterium]|nr:acyl-CoA dehydrogenase C-terminal domain-containing protein [Burkholderiales bacterium]
MRARAGDDFAAIAQALGEGAAALEQAVGFVVAGARSDVRAVYAGSVPYLRLAGIVLCGWQMARAALAASDRLANGDGDQAFLSAKIGTARFYADHLLAQAPGLSRSIVSGAQGVLALTAEQF